MGDDLFPPKLTNEIRKAFRGIDEDKILRMISADWISYQKQSGGPEAATARILDEYNEWYQDDLERKICIFKKMYELNSQTEYDDTSKKKKLLSALKETCDQSISYIENQSSLACQCGGRLRFERSSYTWQREGQKFTITNVPYKKCSFCNNKSINAKDELRLELLIEVMQEKTIFESDYSHAAENTK